MIYDNRNLAYDLRLFEEDYPSADDSAEQSKLTEDQPKPEKENSDRERSKRKFKKISRRKNNFVKIIAGVFLAVAIVFVVGTIIYGQVQLTEINEEISVAQKSLEEKQSLYTQLEMKVDASISTSVVEKYAQEQLNMSKASNSQKEFISLSHGDKAEVTQSSENSVFDNIAEALSSLWS